MTDQEIEDFLAEKVMGWRLHNDYPEKGELFAYWDVGDYQLTVYRYSWHPLSEISQAWQVLEKCTDIKDLGLQRNAEGHQVMSHFMWHFEASHLWACTAEEAAREICMIAVGCVYDSAETARGNRECL